MRFVADCSIVLPWYLEDEKTDYTEMLLDSLLANQVVVPVLWRLEFTNALLAAVRRKRISETRRQEIVSQAERLPIIFDSYFVPLTDISNLARDYHLTTYDAAYLELALRQSLPLATLDNQLIEATTKANVPRLL